MSKETKTKKQKNIILNFKKMCRTAHGHLITISNNVKFKGKKQKVQHDFLNFKKMFKHLNLFTKIGTQHFNSHFKQDAICMI